MSFSLKREIEFYVNDVDSTDGVTKLPVLPDFQLELQANLLQVFRKIIGTDPEMLPRSAVDTISPVSLSFMTYIKCVVSKETCGTTAPEKLLWDSIGGVKGYRDIEEYNPQFGKINRLIPLYIYIKTNSATYKLNVAYVESVEISFDINYILVAKWKIQAISLDFLSSNTIFTNILNYTLQNEYFKNKFAQVTIKDFYNDKTFNIPLTEGSITIQNVLAPVYDKNITIDVAHPKDILVNGRAVNGRLQCYLSTRFNHSKDFLEYTLNNLDIGNKKYYLEYILENEFGKSFSITLPRAIINIPNTEFADVLLTNIEFTSSETEYGYNDDILIKYHNSTEFTGTYDEFINLNLKPLIYYKFNDAAFPVKNYGTGGNTYNLSYVQGSPMLGTEARYSNAKGIFLGGDTELDIPFISATTYVFVSFWYKIGTTGPQNLFRHEQSNNNFLRIWHSNNSLYCRFTSTTVSYGDTNNQWNHVAVYWGKGTGTYKVWINNVLRGNSTFTGTTPLYNAYFEIGFTSDFPDNAYMSEFIYEQHTTNKYDYFTKVVSFLYNTTDTSKFVNIDKDLTYKGYTDDVIVKYRGNSDLYANTVKSYLPMAYWRMNDFDNLKIRDQITTIGNYPLVLSNRPELNIPGPILSDSTSKALKTHAHGSSIQSAISGNIPTSNSLSAITLAFWFKNYSNNDFSNAKQIIHITTPPSSVFVPFGRSTYNQQYCLFYGTTEVPNTRFTIPDQFNTWNFIVVVLQKTTNIINVYVNGVLVVNTTNTYVTTYFPSASKPININISYNTSGYLFSEVAVFPRFLNAEAVQSLYMVSGVTGFTLSLTPINSTINLSGNIPKILRGTSVSPQNSELSISGSIPSKTIVLYNYPEHGSAILVEKWNSQENKYENVPIIIYVNVIYPISSSITFNGNITSILQVKLVKPLNSSINIQGYSTNFLYNHNNVVSGRLSTIIENNIPKCIYIYNVESNINCINITGYTPTINIFVQEVEFNSVVYYIGE